MQLYETIRLAVFGVLLLFSLIVLGLSGNLVAHTNGYSFPGFSVAVAVLTIIIVIPMLVIDRIRKGAVVSWVAVELGWCFFLWVFWLAAAALSTSTFLFTGDCGYWADLIYYSGWETLCRQYQAVQAFLWLGWLLIKVYIILTLVLAILAATRGHSKVWTSPTSDLSFSPTHTKSGEPKIPPVAGGAGAYPNMAYNQGAPVGAPGTGYPPNQPEQPGYPQQPYGAQPGQPGYQQPQYTGPNSASPVYSQPGSPYVPPNQPPVAQV
ncbi:hypothetical protein CPB86DRAFT_804053 [Serendipita vermifera]|nr:hypothetical protein CPB86DRAFT_804053 [Serendipita vermifera]